MWELLKVQELSGIQLTESLAMLPASAVSAVCFASPQSRYFALGKVQKDQVEEYSVRKGQSLEQVEKWLGPNLSYN